MAICKSVRFDWYWFDRHAGALQAIAAAVMLAFTYALLRVGRRQVVIAETQARISEEQVRVGQEAHRMSGPVLRLYWNGFQSQSQNPDEEMLWFAVTVVNEGRAGVPLSLLKLEVLGSQSSDSSDYLTLYPWEELERGRNPQDTVEPLLPGWSFGETARKRPEVNPRSARMFLGCLGARGGYESWKKVRLQVEAPGVVSASVDVDWRLFWMR